MQRSSYLRVIRSIILAGAIVGYVGPGSTREGGAAQVSSCAPLTSAANKALTYSFRFDEILNDASSGNWDYIKDYRANDNARIGSTPYGNHGTVIAGKVNHAYQFSGGDMVIVEPLLFAGIWPTDIPDVWPASGCGGFTIETWIQAPPTRGVVVILDKRTSAPIAGYSLFLYNGVVGFQLASGGIWKNYYPTIGSYGSPPPRSDDGSWHHIAVTLQYPGSAGACPARGTIYHNGDIVYTFTPLGGSKVNTEPLLMGAPNMNQFSDQSGRFHGALDELAIYYTCGANCMYGYLSGGELRPADIWGIWSAGSAGKCIH